MVSPHPACSPGATELSKRSKRQAVGGGNHRLVMDPLWACGAQMLIPLNANNAKLIVSMGPLGC